MNHFGELVNIAADNIRGAILEGCDFHEDIMDETNWSEICNWCKFPDIQHSSSIYERAINTAIYIVAVEQGIEYNIIRKYIKDKLENWWTSPSAISCNNI